ncbi:MAG: 3-dehydroquinate synthase [Planctomycetaceae bacterium]|nr:3-dehydroquinate synthase [Planctomycetaceae bacterium]
MASETTTVHVALSDRSYDIEIGPGLLPTTGRFVAERTSCSHAVVITDSNVEPLHGQRVVESLEQAGVRVDIATVPAGESTKSASHVDQLWRLMLEFAADRKSLVVAVGGGVVGDLAGFIAASYARGIRFVQIPTTLLAQVDSSVGGKVGINLPGAKNMVGAFWQPAAVLIDTDVLNTLPLREYRSGLAEVVKYGVILDPDFFTYLEDNIDGLNNREPSVMRHIVARSCELKAQVVSADEREETGLRAVLNYGHTFCHAFEAETGYGTYLHGEAVAIGMLCASRLAESMGRIDSEITRRQHALLEALGLPLTVPDVSHDVLIRAMQKDKKTEHGKLRFVLPTRMGHVELVSGVPADLVKAALADVHRV